MELPDLTPARKEAIRAGAVRSADYLILGNRVRLAGNSDLPMAQFDVHHSGFRAPAEKTAPDMILYFLCEEEPEYRLTLLLGDQVYRVSREDLVRQCEAALNYVIRLNIRSHYLIHAGCVGRNGRAIILSGMTGMGKSTLTSYLVSRGMEFLSDEVAPLDRRTGWVHPYPLQVGIRPGPAEDLVRDVDGKAYVEGDDHKKLVDPGRLGRMAALRPIPLHAVIFLAQDIGFDVITPKKFDGRIEVGFLGFDDALGDELLRETGSRLLERQQRNADFMALQLETNDPQAFLTRLNAWSARREVPVAWIRCENLDRNDFTRPPVLARLAPSAGILELIKTIGPSQKRRLVDTEFGGSLPRMIGELAGLVKDTSFYKLSVGKLEDMLRLIETLP